MFLPQQWSPIHDQVMLTKSSDFLSFLIKLLIRTTKKEKTRHSANVTHIGTNLHHPVPHPKSLSPKRTF